MLVWLAAHILPVVLKALPRALAANITYNRMRKQQLLGAVELEFIIELGRMMSALSDVGIIT